MLLTALVAVSLVVTAAPATAAAPDQVRGVTVDRTGHVGLSVSWRPVSGATLYVIRASRDRAQTKGLRTAAAGRRKTRAWISGLVSGATYYVTVTARSDNVKGPPSDPVKATTKATRPDAPTGVHITNAGTHGFTVSADPTKYATRWRVIAAKDRHQLRVGSGRGVLSSSWSKQPGNIHIGVPYSAQPYYYRVIASNHGLADRPSPLRAGRLTPPVPTSLAADRNASGGITLRWRTDVLSQRIVVTQSTSPNLSERRRTYTLHSPVARFSPWDVAKGKRYYFSIGATNGGERSARSGTAALSQTARMRQVRVATYNVRKYEGNGSSGQWAWDAQRRHDVVAQIEDADADVIALQEVVHPVKGRGPSMREDIMADLPARYARVVPANVRSANSSTKLNEIIYDSDRFNAPRRKSGLVTLPRDDRGTPTYCTYQVLHDKATGARFAYVSTHLSVGKYAGDTVRGLQTAAMFRAVRARVGSRVPVVYAGDFNSNAAKAVDAPYNFFTRKLDPDAVDVASARRHEQYATGNAGVNPPKMNPGGLGYHLDHVFVDPVIGVRSWDQQVRLDDSGRYITPFASNHNLVRATLVLPTPTS